MNPLTVPAAILLLVVPFAPSATAADDPPVVAVASIGALDLAYDPARWRVDRNDEVTTFACIDRDQCIETLVTATMEPDQPPESCGESALLARFGLSLEDVGISIGHGLTASRIVNDLVLHEATTDIGCRNLAGGPVFVCTRHAGVTYLFDAPGEHCQTHWHHQETVTGLLSGLRPR